MRLVLDVKEHVKVIYDISLDKNKYRNIYRFYDTTEKDNIVVFHPLYKQFVNKGKLRFLQQVNEYKIKILKDQKSIEKCLKWRKSLFNVWLLYRDYNTYFIYCRCVQLIGRRLFKTEYFCIQTVMLYMPCIENQ